MSCFVLKMQIHFDSLTKASWPCFTFSVKKKRFWFIIMWVWTEQAKKSATISKASQGWTIKSIFKPWLLLQQTLMVTHEWFAFVSPLHKFAQYGGSGLCDLIQPGLAAYLTWPCVTCTSDTVRKPKNCAGSQVYFIQSLWFLSEWRKKNL